MDITETEVIDSSEEEILDFTYSITSYGADYPVDSLVNRLRDNKIRIPDFQRGYVWSVTQASRFIESLLLGLPVPGIFLSRDMDSADLLVIDGQQRLKSLLYFYDGYINERVFRLKDVQDRFEGKTYKELDADDRQRLDDSIIHATIVKQDEPSEDNSSIYLVFERLNTGGLQLQPQEIRSAIYSGSFAALLKELNDLPAWRNVYGNRSVRLKDQEFRAPAPYCASMTRAITMQRKADRQNAASQPLVTVEARVTTPAVLHRNVHSTSTAMPSRCAAGSTLAGPRFLTKPGRHWWNRARRAFPHTAIPRQPCR